jgi:hypothetical protein
LAVVDGCPATGAGSMCHVLETKRDKTSAAKVRIARKTEDIRSSAPFKESTSPTHHSPSTATTAEQLKKRVQQKTKVGTTDNQFNREGYSSQLAVLDWKLIASTGSRSLIEIELITGRRHQIRAQFSYEGLPIIGDKLYNPHHVMNDNNNNNNNNNKGGDNLLNKTWKAFTDKSAIALHASSLTIPHPLPSRGLMQLHAPLPELWYRAFGKEFATSADKYLSEKVQRNEKEE